MARPLRVGINARMGGGGVHGGIEQVVVGLASGLSKLDDGDEEYLFLTQPGHDEWLRPHIGGPCRIVPAGGRRLERPIDYLARPLERWAPRMRWGWWRRRWPPPTAGREAGLVPREDGLPSLELSDGVLELAGAELVHFPFQSGFLTKLPTIYEPHDLQHLHLPDLFTAGESESRELRYRAYCEEAELVVMMTSWGARDLIERYGLPESKVAVVNWGSVASLYADPTPAEEAETRAHLSLPDEFVLYPAQTWPHKNHERLLEALAMIRDRHGITVPVVCPGRRNDEWPALEGRIRELGLRDTALFPGFVEPIELRCLYSLARALVFPSRFEGWGMPVSEAFSLGLPVAAADATGTADVVGDAGLLFGPDDVEGMADAVLRLWTDAELRATLVERGAKRAEAFSIENAVRLFRAHYRRIGGRGLTADDSELLDRPPLA